MTPLRFRRQPSPEPVGVRAALCAVARTVLLTWVCAPAPGWAQTATPAAAPVMPSASDMAAQANQMPSAHALEQAARGLPALRVPAAPTPPAAGVPIDVGAMAAQYERLRAGGGAGPGVGDGAAPRQASGLMVFVTLDMPKPSLHRLIADAERVGASMVLRGLRERSMKQTVLQVKAVLGEHKVGWHIDPVLFERFGVSQAPTLVLIDPQRPVDVGCQGDRCAPTVFAKVAGDVSISHALEVIAREDDALSASARAFAQRLEGTR
jgi:conjugal transfer pilus assembly protein TrbC